MNKALSYIVNGRRVVRRPLTFTINSRQKTCPILCVSTVNGNFFPNNPYFMFVGLVKRTTPSLSY